MNKCTECKHYKARAKGWNNPKCVVDVKLDSGVKVQYSARTILDVLREADGKPMLIEDMAKVINEKRTRNLQERKATGFCA